MSREIKWEHFLHESDVGVRGYGRSLEEAFKMAAIALTAVVTPPEKIQPMIKVSVSCTAPDMDVLFNDWLNALLFEMETRNMVFSKFAILILGCHLEATIYGEGVDLAKHHPIVHVNSATFTELQVERQEDTWIAQCVVDV